MCATLREKRLHNTPNVTHPAYRIKSEITFSTISFINGHFFIRTRLISKNNLTALSIMTESGESG